MHRVVQSEILHFKLQPYFSFDQNYFDFHRHFRLGYISVIAQYILQFLYYPVPGTLLFCLVCTGIAYIYRIILDSTAKKILAGIGFVPVLLVLSSLKDYSSAVNTLILFGIAGVFLLINKQTIKWAAGFQLGVNILSLIICFAVFGIVTATILFFGLITMDLNAPVKKRSLLTLSVDTLMLAVFVFLIDGFEIVSSYFSEASPANEYALLPDYWLVSLIFPVSLLLNNLLKIKYVNSLDSRFPGFIAKKWMIPAAILLITWLSWNKHFVNNTKYNELIDYYASEEQWEEVLGLKNKVGLNDRIARYHLNRALYGCGIMSDDLFSVPQEWGEYTLFLTLEANRECTMNSSDLFFDMGYTKAAKYWAYEAQTYNPYSPRVLKRLAICSLLLEEDTLSLKYLHILERSIVHRKWSRKYLEPILANDTAALNRELGKFANYNTDNIFYLISNKPERDLTLLLRNNPENKMAFEYLMSYYLLKTDIGMMLHFLGLVQKFDYEKMPRTYQEAMLLLYVNKLLPQEYFSLIEKTSMEDFKSFGKIMYENRQNPEIAKIQLEKSFGNTLWFYLRFNSMKATKRKFETR